MEQKELLTVTEVCQMLGISRSTFARNRIGAMLRPYKVGKRIKYRKSDIDRLQKG